MPDFEVTVRVLLRDAGGGEQEMRYVRSLERKDLGRFVQALIDTTTQAGQIADKRSAPDGDVETHRRQVQDVSSQATAAEGDRGVDVQLGSRATVQEPSRVTEEKLLRELRGSMEALALHKKEFETFNQRLRTWHESLDGAEQRLEALAAQERQLSFLPERLDEFSQIFRSLMMQADELSSKQASLAKVQHQLSMDTLQAAARNG